MRTVTINKFSGGIVNDPRNQSEGVCRMCTSFDALLNPNKLTPYRSSESGDSSASTRQIKNFAIAKRNSTYNLYGLGVVSGTTKAAIFYKTLTTGATLDLSDATWNDPSVASGTNGVNTNLFVFYERTGRLYTAQNSNAIISFNVSAETVNESEYSVSYTNIAQGLVHTKDNILYVPADNTILVNNNGSWSVGLTIPNNLVINSICEYGDFVAVGAAPLSGNANSVVYLWDRNSTDTLPSQNIDWQEGRLLILEQLQGSLVGISITGRDVSVATDVTRLDNRIIFRAYTAYGAEKFAEIVSSRTGTTSLLITKQKLNNRIYFMMQAYVNGTQRDGVWSVGKLIDGSYSILHERKPNNETSLTSGVLYGFFYAGDYLFQTFSTSSTITTTKTNDQAVYAEIAQYETTINPNMGEQDRTRKKQLTTVSLAYEKLPADSSVKLEYRVDSGSFTEIFTETTTNAMATEQQVDINGDQFTSGREYEFRISSGKTGGTGQGEITELKYQYEILDTLIR